MKTKMSDFIRVKDIVDYPQNINDIFEICQNEINLIKNIQPVAAEYYTTIYYYCLLESHNLTLNNFEIIPEIRNCLIKSKNVSEAKKQHRLITKPQHLIPSLLLRMINNLKVLNFVSEKMKYYNVNDCIRNLIKKEFINEVYISKNFTDQLLRSEITIS